MTESADEEIKPQVECFYMSNRRIFLIPTLLLSVMGFGFGALMIVSVIRDPQPINGETIWFYLFSFVWISVIGGCAALMIWGFIRPTKFYVRLDEAGITWWNTYFRSEQHVPWFEFASYELFEVNGYPRLQISTMRGKFHTIHSVTFATDEELEEFADLLSVAEENAGTLAQTPVSSEP